MSNKLKPLNELVNDVRGNDIVQFFIADVKDEEKPEKSLIGYYIGYNSEMKYAQFSSGPGFRFSFKVDLNIDHHLNYGNAFAEDCSICSVSHYIILQRATEEGKQ